MTRRLLSELEKQARRRVGWITPKNAGRVVTRDIYWTVPFLELYLERCDDLGMELPVDGLALALHAPNLSRLIGVGGRPGEYKTQLQKMSYEVLSLVVLASLFRRTGSTNDAERYYRHAFDIVEKEAVAPTAEGELLRRYGHLRTCLGEESAITYLNRSVQLCQQAGHPDFLADALNTRGHWYANRGEWIDASQDFSHAMLSADRKSKKGKRTAVAATVNLAFVMASGNLDFVNQSNALKCVRQLREQIPRLTHMKCQLLWMEGIINRNLLFVRPAARHLSQARKGMLRLGEAADFVLVSLDLAHVYCIEGENEKYERLQNQTATAFAKIAGEEKERDQLLAALKHWRDLPIAEYAVERIKTQVEATFRERNHPSVTKN